MTPQIRIAIFSFLLFAHYAIGQTPKFNVIGPATSRPSLSIHSWQTPEGTVLLWNAHGFTSDNSIIKPLWIEKIEHAGEKISDTTTALLTPVVKGQKDAVPFCIALSGNKLFALMIVKVNAVTSELYADEIEYHNLTLKGNALKIFEYTHTKSMREPEMAFLDNLGYLTMIQSEDRTKTMFFVNERTSFKTPAVIHSIAFGAGFNETLWNRRDTSILDAHPPLSNTGMAIFSKSLPISAETRRFVEDKDAKTLLYIVTINASGIKKREIYIKDYFVHDFKAVVRSDNGIVGCGFSNSDKNYVMLKSTGIFYISFAPGAENYSVIKNTDFKGVLADGKEELKNYALRDVLISKDNTVWIIGEYSFGVNSKQNYDNLTVGTFGADGSFKTIQFINKAIETTYNGQYAPPSTTFSAQVYNDKLYLLFCDDNFGLTVGFVTPEGKAQTDVIGSFKKTEVHPVNDAFYASSIQGGSAYIICIGPGKGYSPYVAQIQL